MGSDEFKKRGNPLNPHNKNLRAPIKPGEVRNPVGRPIGSRSKFSEAIVSDFLADWHQHGTDVLEQVRKKDPATYLRVASVLVPKEMKVEVKQDGPGNLDRVRELLEILENAGVKDADELRARLAKPIGT
jgi:hypothetical protein